MRAINHALTGALIGLTVSEPLIAVPLAVGSHFVLDIIPHHTFAGEDEVFIKKMPFKIVLVVDALLCLALVVVLAVAKPLNWLLAVICAFLAASPDLLFINRFIKTVSKKKWQPSKFVKWTMDIQWFSKPIGAFVEIVWFAACVFLLSAFL